MKETRACSSCGQRYGPDVLFCPKDGTPLSEKKTKVLDDPYLGLTLASQISIEQLIGIGAMGRVYRAHQSGIDRKVAVKILHRDLLRNPTVKGRFLREAKVASRLSHPNVVQVLMTGEVEHHSADVGGEAYLVMEHLDGISLRSALAAEGGSLPLPRAMHVILQVCDAVGEAHAQGVVHRDLKPENVMLVKRGDDPEFVKVLDFGVARIDWADTTVATQAGVIFGTARYISPEGAQGKTVTAASDVYSIAIMAYQCLSGRTPFDAESPVGILIKHTNEPPPELTTIERASYVPAAIAEVVMRNLAKDPAVRADSARALGRALVAAAREAGLSPDELMVRSTLVNKGTLSLESIQRTKTLPLSEALEKKLRGESTTAVMDDASDEPPEAPAPSTPGSTRSIDPTLADEPVPQSTPPGSTRAPSSTKEGPPPSSGYSSLDDMADLVPPTERPRWLVIAVCFAVGALVAALLARQLGVFDGATAGVAPEVARARAALERGAYDEPSGDNVREITDAALRKYPGNAGLLAVRHQAADRLRLQAEAARDADPVKAQTLAQRALAMDPDNEAAALILRASTTPAPSALKAPAGSLTRVPKIFTAPSISAQPEAGTPDAAPPEPSAAPSAGGRWL
ncbi:MAG: protein kinase [Polyangiaceae bacterium]